MINITNPESLSLSGLGIHTGIPCTISFQKSQLGNLTGDNSSSFHSSIRFPKNTSTDSTSELFKTSELSTTSKPSSPKETSSTNIASTAWQTLNLSDLGAIPRRAAYSTILVGPDFSMRTPEHLFAALLFFPDSEIVINCIAEELPFLDGSALPYAEVLSSLFPSSNPRIWREYATDLIWEKVWENGFIRVKPAEHFKVVYHLQRFELNQNLAIETPEEVWNGILPARSFAFFSEWKNAAKNSTMAGADGQGGILLAENPNQYIKAKQQFPQFQTGDYPLLHPQALRFNDEPIRHKILDLIGDLALLRLALPKLEIEIQNGGHWVHHELMDKLTLN